MFRWASNGLALIQAAPVSSGLPFRSESAVSMDRFVFAMLAVSLFLMAVIVALIMARKKGWLDNVIHRSASTQGEHKDIMIRSSRRLSAFTSVHVLARGDQEFLVVESVRGATAQVEAISRLQEGQERAL